MQGEERKGTEDILARPHKRKTRNRLNETEIKGDEVRFWISQSKKRDGELRELRDIAGRMFVALATQHTDSFVHKVLEDYQSYRKVYTE
jgi:hypothetical protein